MSTSGSAADQGGRSGGAPAEDDAAGAPVAVVTGAGQGIGAAIARELASRGYRLAILARSDAVVGVAESIGALPVRGSMTEVADLQRLVATAMDGYGRIDVLVNNGGHAATGDLLEVPDSDWHEGLDLLLLNVVRAARLVTPVMQSAGGGSIVNVSTFAALDPVPDFPVSATLRAGLAAFTRLYADRYGRDGIRMNNLLPGMIDNWPEDPVKTERTALGRYGTLAEVAAAAAFLAGPESSYVTGQNIRVDGGLARPF
jgi:NAD(P)-dependent dehydrogenase (short-subunit alcohol dehydrogenase family)